MDKIKAKLQEKAAVHLILVGELPFEDYADEEDLAAAGCFNATSKAKSQTNLKILGSCKTPDDALKDPGDPGRRANGENINFVDDDIGMLEAQGWAHFNEFLPGFK
ncbi:hypothetical protein [Helicobacter suis]|uniref:hypothetical protein n=1 Tax=Helicobacter suis TaxID=104628 RepID=UPI0013D691B6|nr:hypothetical protein [Helicobacter suis]